jgi:hypothetical protein
LIAFALGCSVFSLTYIVPKGILAFASDVIQVNDELIPQLEQATKRKIVDIANDPGLPN